MEGPTKGLFRVSLRVRARAGLGGLLSWKPRTHQYGLRMARHGGLHVTGS